MKQNKEILKQFFETGDKPTQQQYADLIDSYVDAKQSAGEPNRRFVIDETGEVSVAQELKIPEYTLSEIVGNKLSLLKDGIVVKEIDLTSYIDDTNLARLVSGTVDPAGMVTFKRDDNSTFTVDFSSLFNQVYIPTLQEVLDERNTYEVSNSAVKSKLEIGADENLAIRVKNEVRVNDVLAGSSILDTTQVTLTSVGVNDNYTSLRPNDGLIYALASDPANKCVTLKRPVSNSIDGRYDQEIQARDGVIANLDQIPDYQAGNNVVIDKTDPAKPVISTSGGGEVRLTKEVLWTMSDFDTFNGGNMQKTHNLNMRYVVKAEWLKADRGQGGGTNARVDIYTETMNNAGYATFGHLDFAAYVMEFGPNDAIYIEYIEGTDLGGGAGNPV